MWKNSAEPNENIIEGMHNACWITKATNTHSQYVIPLLHCNNGHANAPQYYVYMYVVCLV